MIQILSQIDIVLFLALFLALVISFAHFFRQIYHKTPFLHEKKPFFRSVFILAFFLVGVVFTLGIIITNRLVSNEEQKLKSEAMLTISALKTAVEGKVSKNDAGIVAISGSPWIVSYLENPSVKNLEKLNSVLDRYQNAFDASVVYLLDTNGTTVASSNRNSDQSLIGHNYSFRPYFQQSKSGKKSGYFAVGKTTGKRGYFSSAAIENDEDKIIGIVAMKYDMVQLDSIFSNVPRAFLVNQNGIVFITSSPEKTFRPLYPLTDDQKEELISQHQFSTNSFEPLVTRRIGDDKIVMDNQLCFESFTSLHVPGWSISMYSPMGSVSQYRFMGFSTIIALILCIFFVINHLALNRVKVWAEDIFLSEKLFQTMFENAPEAIIICETNSGQIVSANALATQTLGIDTANVCISQLLCQTENNKSDIATPLTASTFKGLFHSSIDADVRYLSVSSAQIQFKGKNCIVSFLRDMSDIINTRNALEESEQRYRELTDFLPEAVFEINLNGIFSFANKRAFELFGYEPADLKKDFSPSDMVIPEERAQAQTNLKRIMNNGTQVHYEYTALHKSGRTFPVMMHSTPIIRQNKIIGVCGICIDMTDRVRFEKEMLKKDKLEALGILAGGIAHDFNNLLTAIWAGLSIIKIKNQNFEQKEFINDIENALQRGRDLTCQLLTYSKGGAPIKEASSLELLVKETAAFTTSGTQVKCDISSDDNLYSAEIDASQISQVVQNLLINAIEAMPQGGVIKVFLRNTENPSVGNVLLPSGKYIELTVSDSGTGIPLGIQQRVFDPFFTTKPNGSGLGLATAYSVVKKHNGHIYIDSLANKGTTFHVLLPATTKLVIQKKNADEIPVTMTGRVLIMDDEMMILTVTKQLLSHLGYSVEIALNGEAAVECYKKALKENNRFDALILDLTIPAGMGGKETIAKLIQIDPQVKALVSSGYSNDPIMANYQNYGFLGVISKPYNVKELSDALYMIMTSGKNFTDSALSEKKPKSFL